MKPIVTLASTTTPDGQTLSLCQHDSDFMIRLGRDELMSSRHFASEQALGQLGCERLAHRPEPAVLIGGLGMGYTLRTALDTLPPTATVVVAEFLPAVVEWNRNFLGELAGYPLQDRRVTVMAEDVFRIIRTSPDRFDAILLDVDNGPHAMTSAANHRLYGPHGIDATLDALRGEGCLSIWSATRDLAFERRLHYASLRFRTYCLPAYPNSRSKPHRVWVISRSAGSLPKAPAAPVRPLPSPSHPAPRWRGRFHRKSHGPSHSTGHDSQGL